MMARRAPATVVAALLVGMLLAARVGADAGGARTHAHAQQHLAKVHLRRALLQAPAVSPNNLELPRLVIGKVKATVTNTYSWAIERSSTAGSIAVTADAYNRKQIGYTLTYTRSLVSTGYRLEGLATITNPSGQGSASLLGLNIVLGSQVLHVACQGMPDARYDLGPAAVIECPFSHTWAAEPGVDGVSGYVETSFGRAPAAEPVAFTFRGCGAAADGASSSMWAPCTLVERAACVSVTDGSAIVNKYADKLGQAKAGTITRSRLFETSTVQDSTLGGPRVEPAVPAAANSQQVAVARVDDPPPGGKTPMPNANWWTGNRRRRALLQQDVQQLQAGRHVDVASKLSVGGSGMRRQLRQKQQPPTAKQQLRDLVAQVDATFQWPYPQVAGDRPPLGLGGKPQRGPERTICASRSFSFSMIFGPLMPAACGTFEVQNFAAALPTDGSSAAVKNTTYMYLQVLCPAAAQATASMADTAAVGATGA